MHVAHVHENQRPFSCPTCHSSYKTKQGLTTHNKAYPNGDCLNAKRTDDDQVNKILFKNLIFLILVFMLKFNHLTTLMRSPMPLTQSFDFSCHTIKLNKIYQEKNERQYRVVPRMKWLTTISCLTFRQRD